MFYLLSSSGTRVWDRDLAVGGLVDFLDPPFRRESLPFDLYRVAVGIETGQSGLSRQTSPIVQRFLNAFFRA